MKWISVAVVLVISLSLSVMPLGISTDYAVTSTASAATSEVVVLDQSFTSPYNLGANINECCRFIAQTFTAGRSGTLAGVNINVGSSSSYQLHVAIRTVAGAVPSTTILGETTLSSNSAPLSTLITFPQTINIVAGNQYAIVVDYPDAPPAGAYQYQGGWTGATGNSYPGGAIFASYSDGVAWDINYPDYDLHFQTWVRETIVNSAPTANAGGPYNVNEGASVVLTASGSDPDGDALTYAWDLDNNGTFETPGRGATFSAATLDGPSSRSVGVQVTDTGGLTSTAQATVNVVNVAPTVGSVTAPLDPVQVNTAINASANFADHGVLDTHTAVWNWGDGSASPGSVIETNGSGAVSASHTYTATGVYSLTLTVTDKDGASGNSSFQYVVVYDPSGGFVTGAGLIDSPPGAYVYNPSLVGKANFGFVARYQQGATTPSGNTQFRFQMANLGFASTTYEWLVVSGARAQFKGSGTLNGSGDYGFMLTAIDGQLSGGGGADQFRIKIWDKATGNIIYDNQVGAQDTSDTADPATAIAAGSIVVQK
ncbi:MAG: PKD domain-containing protein [Chloroflexi bacterium]|nr:PKD domain-containing protein [Chloroflexota bacterium]